MSEPTQSVPVSRAWQSHGPVARPGTEVLADDRHDDGTVMVTPGPPAAAAVRVTRRHGAAGATTAAAAADWPAVAAALPV